MKREDLHNRLEFLRHAEGLKNTLRSAHTSQARQESAAEHSWRLCLFAMVFEDQLSSLDFIKVLKMCVVHDLGEIIGGDIPAVEQQPDLRKSEHERNDLLKLMHPLPAAVCAEFLMLWDEYESASSPEAQAVKALDKLETIMQHNQGANPDEFDYEFNLSYGSKYMHADPLFAQIRAVLDKNTRYNMGARIFDEQGG